MGSVHDDTLWYAQCRYIGAIEQAAPEMLAALRGLAVIAEQHITDLCADAQEGNPIAKMELSRWNAVLSAIAKAEGHYP